MRRHKKNTSFYVAILLGIILIIVIGIFVIYMISNNNKIDDESSSKETISDEDYYDGNKYEDVDISDIINCLKNEGLEKANEKYYHKCVKFTAKFSSLAKDLSYVSVTPQNSNDFLLLDTEYTNYEQMENAKKLKKGDNVIVRAYIIEAFGMEDDDYTAYKIDLQTINQ